MRPQHRDYFSIAKEAFDTRDWHKCQKSLRVVPVSHPHSFIYTTTGSETIDEILSFAEIIGMAIEQST